MVSHMKHNYKGKVIMPNERFTADSEQDAAELETFPLRFASRIATRELKAEGVEQSEESRRDYKRRDMQAEKG